MLRRIRGVTKGRSFRLLLVASWLLGSVPSILTQSGEVTGDFAVVFWNGGAYFYSLLLFWAMTRALYRRTPPHRSGEDLP